MNENSTPVPSNNQPSESFQSFSSNSSKGERLEGEVSPVTRDSGREAYDAGPVPCERSVHPSGGQPGLSSEARVRNRGAQEGNQNARKHGLYAKYLNPKQRQDYNEACGVRGVEVELGLFRCKLAEMLGTEPWNWTLLNRIANTILRLEAALPEELPERKSSCAPSISCRPSSLSPWLPAMSTLPGRSTNGWKRITVEDSFLKTNLTFNPKLIPPDSFQIKAP
jgi:hypothetical protein